ncbi:hypothetical protein B0H14DRAFT_2572359 [Mycena olivaceomarginata]|nr:hypothetical protein B0H14DRAFT_2572359 [Mycena olivaceomarginata]
MGSRSCPLRTDHIWSPYIFICILANDLVASIRCSATESGRRTFVISWPRFGFTREDAPVPVFRVGQIWSSYILFCFSSSPPTNPISGERPVRSTAFDQKLLSYSYKDIDVWRIEISKSMDEMNLRYHLQREDEKFLAVSLTELLMRAGGIANLYKKFNLFRTATPRYYKLQDITRFKILQAQSIRLSTATCPNKFIQDTAESTIPPTPRRLQNHKTRDDSGCTNIGLQEPCIAKLLVDEGLCIRRTQDTRSTNSERQNTRPRGKKQYNRESLTDGKAPRRRDEARARCGQKKNAARRERRERAMLCWWVERVGGKTVERGTATLQAYNVLQCWWLVREIIPRKTNPAGVQRLAALVVGQRKTNPAGVQRLAALVLVRASQNSLTSDQPPNTAGRCTPAGLVFLGIISEITTRTRTTITARRYENIQIRAYSYLQSKKTPQRTPPLRRGTRASLDPVRSSGTRTIEIPLDPILVTSRAYVNKISGLADTVDCDTAHVWAAQAKECRGRAAGGVDKEDECGGQRRGRAPIKTTRGRVMDRQKRRAGGIIAQQRRRAGWVGAPTMMMRGWVGPRADNGDERVGLRADKDAKTGGRMRTGHNTKVTWGRDTRPTMPRRGGDGRPTKTTSGWGRGVDKDDGQAGPRADNGDERVGPGADNGDGWVELHADKDATTWGRMRAGQRTKMRPCDDPGDVGAGCSPDMATSGWVRVWKRAMIRWVRVPTKVTGGLSRVPTKDGVNKAR